MIASRAAVRPRRARPAGAVRSATPTRCCRSIAESLPDQGGGRRAGRARSRACGASSTSATPRATRSRRSRSTGASATAKRSPTGCWRAAELAVARGTLPAADRDALARADRADGAAAGRSPISPPTQIVEAIAPRQEGRRRHAALRAADAHRRRPTTVDRRHDGARSTRRCDRCAIGAAADGRHVLLEPVFLAASPAAPCSVICSSSARAALVAVRLAQHLLRSSPSRLRAVTAPRRRRSACRTGRRRPTDRRGGCLVGSGVDERQVQVPRLDGVAVGEDHRALDAVLQLAHVARPAIRAAAARAPRATAPAAASSGRGRTARRSTAPAAGCRPAARAAAER